MTNPKEQVPWTAGPWSEYTSNSFSRIGTKDGYEELIYAVRMSDGFPTLAFKNPVDKALVIESPTMAALLGRFVADGLLSQSDAAEARACLARIGRGK